jgi:hypothetical protein
MAQPVLQISGFIAADAKRRNSPSVDGICEKMCFARGADG